ncbi:substrate-binding domain-containing protein [Mangrovicoccus ximenensis]|uniref:substrate-binding domain-containing protein n=1 Tax=Mangrovicoccus ximenensis TaxID=1911570 RepID=UPI000D3DBC89|nr:substrate-binding domain-containing protein [Mangrovicoccus ximenensis]
MHRSLALAAGLGLAAAPALADEVALFAAGSLKAALSDVAEDFAETYGTPVAASFGPSGLMRERIEAGGGAHVFASANMRHPQVLAGRSGRRGSARGCRCAPCRGSRPAGSTVPPCVAPGPAPCASPAGSATRRRPRTGRRPRSPCCGPGADGRRSRRPGGSARCRAAPGSFPRTGSRGSPH